ncbi:VOC family protein [Cryobacterium sandaracinum]|uniref:VOC family protein n=1 Tax=Cryobacterium sandaracinum TaxID=1259247 RepID=A0ABY2JF95_9MICO|nr:VOC family protein [Cryobacterium sandaracinum]TFD02679.1 VOC family protein [Cryobacterium sandaracinum]
MPAPHANRTGQPCWADLMTSDLPRAREFYTRLFGWTASDSGLEYGNYVTFRKGDADVAGMSSQEPGSRLPDAWTTYLSVTDADAAVTAARAAGADVLAEPMTVGTMGRMAILMDPTGAPFGVWQADEFTGFDVFGEAGSPVWHELNTRSYSAALDFYTEVFGWKPVVLSDTEDFRYSTIGAEGEMVTGVFDAAEHLPDSVPSHWQLYLGVPDVHAAVTTVTELGGTVVREPWTAEFGTFALVTDPTGALFVLGSVDEPLPEEKNIDDAGEEDADLPIG